MGSTEGLASGCSEVFVGLLGILSVGGAVAKGSGGRQHPGVDPFGSDLGSGGLTELGFVGTKGLKGVLFLLLAVLFARWKDLTLIPCFN